MFFKNPYFIYFILLPIIGGLHGWVTNFVAIKLLFRPREPIIIPLIGFRLQGLLPKRKDEIAESIGNTIEKELLPVDDIVRRLGESGIEQRIVSTIVSHVEKKTFDNIPKFIPSNLRLTIVDYFKEYTQKEAKALIAQLMKQAETEMREKMKIGDMVQEKITAFDMAKLEEIIVQIAGKELKHIEWLGFFMGVAIAIIQGFVLLALDRF